MPILETNICQNIAGVSGGGSHTTDPVDISNVPIVGATIWVVDNGTEHATHVRVELSPDGTNWFDISLYGWGASIGDNSTPIVVVNSGGGSSSAVGVVCGVAANWLRLKWDTLTEGAPLTMIVCYPVR
jgi:hypothetical protein